MEGSDPFAQVETTGENDPFAGTEFGDFEQHEPTTDGDGEASGELKTVDKEGNEVAPGQAAPAHAPNDGAQSGTQTEPAAQPTSEVDVQPQAAPAPAEVAQEATPDPTPSSPEPSPAATPDASPQPGEPAPSEPAAAAAPSGESTPASTEATNGASAEQTGGDQGDPTPASPAQPSPAATSDSSSSESSDVEDAPLPEEPKDKRGRATARRYVILRVDGPGKFTQVHWYESADGKMLTKREPGSKRQTVALCKNAEDALKVGFAACGGPQDGVNLVATAALHFQPKVVKPLPPEPSKQRLQIS
jgi:hypothetical protein